MDKKFDTLLPSPAAGVSRREALRKLGSGLAGVMLATSSLGNAHDAVAQSACGDSNYLMVGGYDNPAVLCYDGRTGAFVRQFDRHNRANLTEPVGGVLGRDGNLYVSSGIFDPTNPSILQYNARTGTFKKRFASQNITSPRGVLFGPDGNLYVANGNDAASGDPASVIRFDGQTGEFIDYFVTPASGGLDHPSYMVFGPNGRKDGKLDLYVASAHAGSILRYDGATGAFKGVFVAAACGGLDSPQGMVFGCDGDLFVASGNWFDGSNGPFYSGDFPPGAVLRFHGPSAAKSGTFIDTFIPGGYGGLANPIGLLFGPEGDLFVASCVQNGDGNDLLADPGTNQVLRYDGRTGRFKGAFVTLDSGGVSLPTFMTFTETDPTTLNYR